MFDATLVTAHSDKESAAANFKGGWGFHPLTAWLDNTGEASLRCCGRATPVPTPRAIT